MARKYDAYDNMLKDLLQAGEQDNRLTPGQLHAVVVDALGAEPIQVAALLHDKLRDAKSKMRVAPQTLFDMALRLHDRIYPPPDHRTRKVSEAENQFQLEFAWADMPAPEEERTNV